jgi:spore germination protein KC
MKQMQMLHKVKMVSKMKKTKFFVIAFIFLFSFFLTACWDQIELDELFIVVGMAIDKTENPEEFELSIQIVKTTSTSGGSGGSSQQSGQGSDVIVIKEKGKTALEAVAAINYDSSRNITFQHNRVLLISTDIAQESVMNYLDFFLREEQIRLELIVVLVEGKASEILEVQPGQEPTSGKYVYNIINDIARNVPIYKVRLIDFFNNYLSKSRANLLPVIKKEKVGEEEKIKFFSTAFFVGDNFIQTFENKEFLGYVLSTDSVKELILTATEQENLIDYYILELKNKRKSNLDEQDNLNVEMEIKVLLKIGEIIGFDDVKYPEFLKMAKAMGEKQIKLEVETMFDKLKTLGIDGYEFATEIFKKNPKKWKEIEGKWNEILKNAKLSVKADVEIVTTGQSLETVKMEFKKNENR